jgi:hypothetical protein
MRWRRYVAGAPIIVAIPAAVPPMKEHWRGVWPGEGMVGDVEAEIYAKWLPIEVRQMLVGRPSYGNLRN